MKQNNHKTNYVFVLDRNKKPLQPCSPARGRILQKQGKAKKLRMYPFTLILDKELDSNVTHELEIRIDPGSRTTGIALIDIKTQRCIWALHIEHRGQAIKDSLEKRAGYRRSRRTRNVRHRKARFHQRRKPLCWLPPSLMHRIQTIETWLKTKEELRPKLAGIGMGFRPEAELLMAPPQPNSFTVLCRGIQPIFTS